MFESQDDAVEGILGDKVVAGDVVVIRYEGPKGGPGMQEMLYPTSHLKSKGLGKVCALFTDGRFSGGSSGLVIGHASPEAAEGGTIGLVEDGDVIEIDIPRRKMHLAVSDEVLARRREAMNAREKAWEPVDRERVVSLALQAYAALATSADRGRCGIFRSSSRSVEGLGFEKTAPLWRRFCASWVAPRAGVALLAPDCGPEPSLRTSLGAPFVILVAACGGCLRIPSGASRLLAAARPARGAASFDGCGVAGAVVGGGFASPQKLAARAASFCIRGGLRRGVLVVEGVPCLAVSVGVCCVACCSPFMRIAVRTLLSQSRLPIHIQWRHILMRREARQHFLRQFLDGFGGGAA